MDDMDPGAAKSVSAGTPLVPFGMPALDSGIGGIPRGSAALLAGAVDAGADAFAFTQAGMLMLAKANPELAPSGLGDVDGLPERVVYVTLGAGGRHVLNAMDAVLDEYQLQALLDNLTLLDYSEAFLDLVPSPEGFARPDDDAGPVDAVRETPDVDSFEELLTAIATAVDDVAEDALVIFSSLDDLRMARELGLSRESQLGFLIGLREAAEAWNGIVYARDGRQTSVVRSDTVMGGLFHGNLYFYSNDQGFDTYRTMRVGSFRGALDREEQVVYRTIIGPTGFRVKTTKKIGPSSW